MFPSCVGRWRNGLEVAELSCLRSGVWAFRDGAAAARERSRIDIIAVNDPRGERALPDAVATRHASADGRDRQDAFEAPHTARAHRRKFARPVDTAYGDPTAPPTC